MRAIFTLASPNSDAIVRLGCRECGTAMVLVGIEPSHRHYELHTFECPICEGVETTFAKAANIH
jgi:hypothetical protein